MPPRGAGADRDERDHDGPGLGSRVRLGHPRRDRAAVRRIHPHPRRVGAPGCIGASRRAAGGHVAIGGAGGLLLGVHGPVCAQAVTTGRVGVVEGVEGRSLRVGSGCAHVERELELGIEGCEEVQRGRPVVAGRGQVGRSPADAAGRGAVGGAGRGDRHGTPWVRGVGRVVGASSDELGTAERRDGVVGQVHRGGRHACRGRVTARTWGVSGPLTTGIEAGDRFDVEGAIDTPARHWQRMQSAAAWWVPWVRRLRRAGGRQRVVMGGPLCCLS